MPLAEIAPSVERTKNIEKKPFLEKADDAINVLRQNRSLFEMKRSGATTTQAIETTALSLAESEDQNLSQSEKNLFGVIGHLGSYVVGERIIEEITEENSQGQMSRSEYEEMKYIKINNLIPFNHALKELINTDSSLTKDELDAGLTRLYMRLFYSDDPMVKYADRHNTHDQKLVREVSRDTLERISVSSNGMRHEIAAESMLAAAGYHCEYEVSTEEDSSGVDMYAYVDGEWVAVDIKASAISANNALTKRKRSHAVWTGLEQSDFKGAKGDQINGLRIPFDIALDHANDFVDRIRSVAHR
jgi:hypothetical protein